MIMSVAIVASPWCGSAEDPDSDAHADDHAAPARGEHFPRAGCRIRSESFVEQVRSGWQVAIAAASAKEET
jgi:hypothetical protein